MSPPSKTRHVVAEPLRYCKLTTLSTTRSGDGFGASQLAAVLTELYGVSDYYV